MDSKDNLTDSVKFEDNLITESINVISHDDTRMPNFQNMLEFFRKQLFVDVTLIADDHIKIRAHRLVICSASEYFKQILSRKVSTGRPKSKDRICVPHITSGTMATLVEYCYTGTFLITTDTVEDLMTGAFLYQFRYIRRKCAQFCGDQLTIANCLSYWVMGDLCESDLLKCLASPQVCDNFMDIVKTEDFKNLDVKQLQQWLICDDIYVGSEEDVFHTITTWVDVNRDDRKKYYADLLDAVRLSAIKYKFLHGDILNYSKALGKPDVFVQVCELKSAHYIEEKKPRSSTCILAIGGSKIGLRDEGKCISIERYCFRSNLWKFICNIPEERQNFGVVYIDDQMILLGGSKGETLNTVATLNLRNLQLTPLAPMLTARAPISTIVFEDYIYAIGGRNNNEYLNSVERFSVQNNEWTEVAPMLQRRAWAAVVQFMGKLYVIGGRNNSLFHDSVEYYASDTDKWTMLAPLNRKRSGACAVVSNGIIYVIGGHNDNEQLTTIEMFDSFNNKWFEITTSLAVPLSFGYTVDNEWVYLAGGLKRDDKSNEFGKFNTKTNKMKNLSPMIEKRSHFHLIHVEYFSP